jgi:hypothetical protein
MSLARLFIFLAVVPALLAAPARAADAAPADDAAPAADIGATAHPFPDASARIMVFADQLPSEHTLTDAQWKFIASHYSGTQKESSTWTRHIRRLNPRFIVLHYQLAVGCGPAEFVVGDRWTNDFKEAVNPHEDWFIHDEQGRRQYCSAWQWYVMDLRFNARGPSTAFPRYWTQSAISRMRANEDDGCFADSYTQDILMRQLKAVPQSLAASGNAPDPHQLAPSDMPMFNRPDACNKLWIPSLDAFGDYCTDAFHRQREKFYYLPNLGGLVTTWDKTNLAVGDGGMNEGFCAERPGSYLSLGDWKLAMSRLGALAAQDKILLCQTNTDPASPDHTWFLVGSYLLTKGRHSYINLMHKGSLEWYPQYDVDLGKYTTPPAADVMHCWDPGLKVFKRSFEKGMVLVNPTDKAVTIAALDGDYEVYTAMGGGAIDAGGRAHGTLTLAPVVFPLAVPAHSARVLRRR